MANVNPGMLYRPYGNDRLEVSGESLCNSGTIDFFIVTFRHNNSGTKGSIGATSRVIIDLTSTLSTRLAKSRYILGGAGMGMLFFWYF